jgi:hypothetical protein
MTYHRNRILDFLRNQGVPGTDEYLVPLHQIMLLGGNPMPVRIALEALRPERAVILTTREAENTIPFIRDQTKKFGVQITVRKLDSPRDQSEIFKVVREIIKELQSGYQNRPVGLHYTGGTKSMAAHALTTWWIHNENGYDGVTPNHWCTYMDGDNDELVFDSVVKSFNLGEIRMSLEEITSLHGLKISKQSKKPENTELVNEIAYHCFGGKHDDYYNAIPPWNGLELTDIKVVNNIKTELTEIAKDKNDKFEHKGLLEGHNRNWQGVIKRLSGRITHKNNYKNDGVFANWRFDNLAKLCPSCKDIASWDGLKTILKTDNFEKCASYLASLWLEDYVLLKIKDMQKVLGIDEVWQGVELERIDSGMKFELDVIFVKGHTPVVVSITTENKKTDVKRKFLEVAVRSGQIGGDFTRHVILSFIEDNSDLVKLWNELVSNWTGPDIFRVLGFQHLEGKAAFSHLNKCGEMQIFTIEDMLIDWFKK